MTDGMKSVLINKIIHKDLKKFSQESGMKIKDIVEKSIKKFIKEKRENEDD